MTAIIAPSRRLPVPQAADVPAWVPGALVGLAVFCGLLCVCGSFLNDPDTQWHIAAGRWMWENGRVPTTDPFSHTFAGAPWIAKEWLSQLVLYADYAWFGWAGVAALTAAVIAGCYAVIYGWMTRHLRPTLALLTLALAFAMGGPQLLARPHLLALPAIVWWMMGLADALEAGRAPSLRLVLPMVLWANLHASFPLGLAVAGALAGEAVFAAPAHARRAVMIKWGLFLLAALCGACATPYGGRILLLVVNFLNTPEATQFITEWQPLTVDLQGIATVAAAMVALAVLLPDWRRTGFRVAVVVVMTYLSVRHQRFALLFGIMAPFLVAGPAALRLGEATDALLRVPSTLLGAALAALIGIGGALATTIRPGPGPAVTPAGALAYVLRSGLTGPVYNDYDFGGTLILDGIRTFIDGRSDQLFAGGFTKGLYAAVDARDDAPFATLLDRYGVRWAVVHPASKDAAHLVALGWHKTYEDDIASVFVRP